MKRKKNSFFTFIFSLLPGAGQMYMGFMKRGLSLMTIFFFVIFLSAWLNLGTLLFSLPIIWFFAFFDTHNLRSAPDEEFYALVDDYLLLPDIPKDKFQSFQKKYRNVLGITFLVIGVSVLWKNLFQTIRHWLPAQVRHIISDFIYILPQLCIGIGIIVLGIYLIRGKKRELDMNEPIRSLEDKGGNTV